MVGLSGKKCPDCGRLARLPFQETITGRLVCPDCATALRQGSSVGVITGDVGSGLGAWAMLKRRLRRKP